MIFSMVIHGSNAKPYMHFLNFMSLVPVLFTYMTKSTSVSLPVIAYVRSLFPIGFLSIL